MELFPVRCEVDNEKSLTWVNVEITADVDMEGGMLPECLEPLDVVIILDIMSVILPYGVLIVLTNFIIREDSPIAMLQFLANAAYLLASEMAKCDQFAIACVDNSEEGGLRVLLPLDSYPLRGVKRVLDKLPHHADGIWNRCGLHRAILRASDMLAQGHPKDALSHIFLITADRQECLVPRTHAGVGFHTISLDTHIDLGGPGPCGWHIYPDKYPEMKAILPENENAVLMNKILRAITQLRTGLAPGVVRDLVLELAPGTGCYIESVTGATYRSRLRPGEKWVLLVQVRMPDEVELDDGSQVTDDSEGGRVEDLMYQLQRMLGAEGVILNASLQYSHSLLPVGTVYVGGHCQGIRGPPA